VRSRTVVLTLLALVLALGGLVAAPTVASAGDRDEAVPFTAATVTQAADGGYDVAWKAPSSAGKVQVHAGTDPDEIDDDTAVGSGGSSGTVHVTGLAAAPRWYFELDPAKGASLVTADHSLHLASAPNLRDIGGYRTSDGRWVKVGELYRSDGLDALSDADNATLQALGVKLVCDLRTNGERASKPDKEIAGSTNEQIDVSGEDELTATITAAITSGDTAEQQRLFGDGKGEQLLIDGGRAFVSGEIPKAAYTTLFERIEDPANLPTVMHCSGGKDRTGWASAAILTALGVPRSTVTQDYLASNGYLQEKNDKTLAATAALIDRSLLEPLVTVRKEYLDASFGEVKAKYTTFDEYLAAIGVTKADKQQLQDELLEGERLATPRRAAGRPR
jgi:protein-tyrosine phosphatase